MKVETKAFVGLPIAILAILGLPFFVDRHQSAYAADCLSSSGAASVLSVQNACSKCTAGGGGRGAAWINNQSTKSQSTVYGSKWENPINFTLWGQVYSCDTGTSSGGVYAANVSLLAADAQNRLAGEGTDASGNYLTPRAPGVHLSGTSFFRGVFQGRNAWSTGGSLSGNTLTPSQFFDNPNAQCKDGSAGSRVCEREVWVYRCFSTNGSYATSDRNGNGIANENPGDWASDTACYSDASAVRMLLRPEDTDVYNNYFESTSRVDVAEQGDVSQHTLKTEVDSKPTNNALRFSTDQTTVRVTFSHDLRYKVADKNQMKDIDTFEPISTTWTVEQRVKDGGSTSDYSEWGGRGRTPVPDTNWTLDDSLVRDNQHKVRSDSNGHTYSHEVVFNFIPNGQAQTKTICERISYQDKEFKYTSKDQENGRGGYIYGANGRGSGKSGVCVTIDYVGADENGNEPLASGSVDLNGANISGQYVMFAGESANLSINGSANGIKTRRLIGEEAVVFGVRANLDYDPSLTKKDLRYVGRDLCPLYTSTGRIPTPYACYQLEGYTVDYGSGKYTDVDDVDPGNSLVTTSNNAVVAVPDDVGEKYCNAFGYKFAYYYSVKKEGENDGRTVWTHEEDKDYIYVPDAMCRTIAKKPTVAFWNGGVLMANGEIATSLAQRHIIGDGGGPQLGYMRLKDNSSLTDANGQSVKDDSTTLYGSWSEYLAISGEKMTNARAIGSGSSLSLGAKSSTTICSNTEEPWSTNSPLTVANVGCDLGNAGEGLSSSSFRTRLETYLQENAGGIERVSDVEYFKNNPIGSGTKILDWRGHSDALWITNNIEIDTQKSYSLRNIPQVIVITDGDINITGNVTRIDAWIITKGTVHTCAWKDSVSIGYKPGDTEYNKYISSDGVGVASTVCTNQLVFNGPVVASNMDLRRNFGADAQAKMTRGINTEGALVNTSRESSAEVFNLRADTYLWAYEQASRYDSSYSEAYTRELAPRY